MPAREVTFGERERAVEAAAQFLDGASEAWLDAHASGDRNRMDAAEAALGEAVLRYRRTSSALEKTEKRLARRAELTKETSEHAD